MENTKKLYFWLPTSAIGSTVAISNVKLLTADGTLVDTEYPFTLPEVPKPGNPSDTKRYVTFEVDTEDFSKELKAQLNKRYDGISFNWDLLNTEIANQKVEVPQPQGGVIDDPTKLEDSAVRLYDANGEQTVGESSSESLRNAGIYSITVNYSKYANDTEFSKTFWGHQTTLAASITPADTRLVEVTYKPTMEKVTDPDEKESTKLTQMDFTATVLPKKGEATTCEAPDGFIQFYINGVKVGDPVSLNESKTRSTGTVETGTTDGYNSKTVTKSVSFRTTTPPVPEAGEFTVEARYYGGTNYTVSEAKATKAEDDPTQFDPDKDFPYIAPPTPVVKPSGSDIEVDPEDPTQVIPGAKLPPAEVERIDPPGGATADENNYRLHGTYHDSVSQKTEKDVDPADAQYFADLLNKRYVFVDKAGHPLKGTDGKILLVHKENLVITNEAGEPVTEVDLSEKGKYLITAEVKDANGNKTTIELTFNLRTPAILNPDLNKDTDGDGKPDINIDKDGDGIPETNIDTDGDDKPDINIDTDGDGKPDVDIDKDGDGKPDINKDTDGDGKPDVDIDTDGDGKPDINKDTDGDGKPDLDIDKDGDGKPDVNVDIDGDGKPDINKDTDGDGKPDLDIDKDGDGKPDVNVDTDGDGKPDINIDKNGDGKPDVNIDKDGDGKPDVNVDTDGDGKPDINIDKNGDGKPDVNIDTDGDGEPDINVDTNGDGKPDINIDKNGDGKPDKNIVNKDELPGWTSHENGKDKTDELPWWIPRTGDTANMLIWFTGLVIALFALVGIIYGAKRKNLKNN